ncbi:energy transducer TonB [Flavobacterium sp.]|jgi:outer membrane biosynthesis protein TonB|uniref:energy transducer TonB n=1 Tax=Flavobacterium sp. TaxID=239 RepID=UPI0037BF61C1
MRSLFILVISLFIVTVSVAQQPSGSTSDRLKELAKAKKALEEAKNKEWDAYLVRVAESKLAKQQKKQQDSITKATTKVVDDLNGFTKCDQPVLPFFKVKNSISEQEEEIPFIDFFRKHVANKFSYPSFAIEHEIEGTVLVQFLINKEGNPEIMDARGPENGLVLEEEAIRIIKAMPTCVPAFCDGKPIKVSFALPIKFQM